MVSVEVRNFLSLCVGKKSGTNLTQFKSDVDRQAKNIPQKNHNIQSSHEAN